MIVCTIVFYAVSALMFAGAAYPATIVAELKFEQKLYKVGDVLRGTCLLKPEFNVANATSENIVITGENPLKGRLTRIENRRTLEFTVDPVELEDWLFTCYYRFDNGSEKLLYSDQVLVGQAPLPLSVNGHRLIVYNWERFEAEFWPTYEEQRQHCLREDSDDSRIVPSVHIQWSPGRHAKLRECTVRPPHTLKCVESDGVSRIDLVFNVTVNNTFGTQTREYHIQGMVKPDPVQPSAKALSSTTAEIRWKADNHHLRYNITLWAENVEDRKSIIESSVVDWSANKGTDRTTVEGLIPHGSYRVSLSRRPLFSNGTERGYDSDVSTSALTMPEDVPAKNPEILPAVDDIMISATLREVVVYFKPIEEKYRNGQLRSVRIHWQLDDGSRTGSLRADESALKILNVSLERPLTLNVWAVNVNLGKNETLPNRVVTIQKKTAQPLAGVQAIVLADGKNVSVTLSGEMRADLLYYIVHCEMDLSSRTCKDYPALVPLLNTTQTIALLSRIKLNTHRVGVYSLERNPVLAPRTKTRRSVAMATPESPDVAGAIVWSPCVYNLSSVPKLTPVEVTACTACINVQIGNLPCDETGTKIENYTVKYVSGPREFSPTVLTKSQKIVLPVAGSYTVSVQAASQGGLGPALLSTLDVPGPDLTSTLVGVSIAILFVFFIFVALSGYCFKRRQEAMNRASLVRQPEVDVEQVPNVFGDEVELRCYAHCHDEYEVANPVDLSAADDDLCEKVNDNASVQQRRPRLPSSDPNSRTLSGIPERSESPGASSVASDRRRIKSSDDPNSAEDSGVQVDESADREPARRPRAGLPTIDFTADQDDTENDEEEEEEEEEGASASPDPESDGLGSESEEYDSSDLTMDYTTLQQTPDDGSAV